MVADEGEVEEWDEAEVVVDVECETYGYEGKLLALFFAAGQLFSHLVNNNFLVHYCYTMSSDYSLKQ